MNLIVKIIFFLKLVWAGQHATDDDIDFQYDEHGNLTQIQTDGEENIIIEESK